MAGERTLKLRHELKHQIDPLQYSVLQKKLATVLKPDPHMGKNGRYNVRNLYFDDFEDTALRQKEAGIANRSKYRLRIYNHNDEVIKFERKSKISQYTLKESAKITRHEAERMIAGDTGFLAKSQNRLIREFCKETHCRLMRPAVVVEYEREAYVHPVGNVRITFDTSLCTSLGPTEFFDCNLCTTGILRRPEIIMEIKYDELMPQFICGLFPDTIRPRMSIGKFVLCRTQQRCQAGRPAGGLSCIGANRET